MGPITKKLATMDTRGVDTFIKFAKKMNGEQSPAIQEMVTGILLVALEHVTHASVTLA